VPRRVLLTSVVLLVALRVAVVACGGDVFGYGEEFVKGAAAKAMLDGLAIEHHRLPFGYHEGGGFVIVHVKALLFALMGENVLAHKVGAILSCAVILWIGCVFAREHLAPRAAWIFAAFFALAPLNFVRFSLLHIGTHFEALFFVLLVLHFALRLARAESMRLRDAAWLGLVGGFGLYFSLQLAPALLAAALWILWKRKGRVLNREMGAVLVAFVAGATPLWIMLFLVGKAALVVRGREVLSGGMGFFASLAGMLEPLTASTDALTWPHALVFVVAIAAGVVLLPRAAHGIVALYLGLYTLAYTLSGLALPYDPELAGAWFFLLRLAPLWLFATLLAAHGACAAWERGGLALRVVAALAIAIPLANGARDLVSLCADGRPSTPIENLRLYARTKGYTYAPYFDKLQDHLDGDRREKMRVLLGYREDPRVLVPAIVQSLYERAHDPVQSVVEECRATFGDDWRYAPLGLGRYLHVDWHYDLPAAFAQIETMPADAREALAEGLGRAGFGPHFLPRRLSEQIAQEVPAPWRTPWLRGVGWRVHFAYRFRPDLAREFLDGCAREDRPALERGFADARDSDMLRARR
jgi:hypothetical protein